MAEKTQKKMGRPKKEIDQTLFEKLCGIMCTEEEIAGIMDCSIDTIERWCKDTYGATFADIYKKYSAAGKSSLRRIQFKLAERSAAMAIFLGKQYLGQTDYRTEQAGTAPDDGFIEALKGTAKEDWQDES